MGQNKPRWSQACQFTKLMFSFYLNKKCPSFFVRGALSCCGCLSSFVKMPTKLPVSLQILWIIGITWSSTGLINKKIGGVFLTYSFPFLLAQYYINLEMDFFHTVSHAGSTLSSLDHKVLTISFFQGISNQPLLLPHPGLYRKTLFVIHPYT